MVGLRPKRGALRQRSHGRGGDHHEWTGFTTDVGSVRVCTGGVWLYETKIPNDSEGTLWGSVETLIDGQFAGVTGQAVNSAGTPVIDYSAGVYTVSPMFTNDGSTEITCEAPLT